MVTGTTPMIATKGLTKIYGDGTEVRALHDVSLTVNSGEFVAIMGPSGSGKSTLLNLIGTLDSPTSGVVRVNNVDVGTLSGNALADFRRQTIGFIFQLFNLIPTLTALENVMLPLIPYQRGLPFKLQERARELLEAVGLGQRLSHLPGQLSGGEQQRVAIARALVNEPRIILADEPTGNVDTKAGDEVMELLKRVREEWDQTVVVVTHSPRVAAYADRAYFLKDGSIVDESDLSSDKNLELIWKGIGLN
ncbi:MAG TPA: ABC transporter ATP-binding protein [Chloroflexi bacterium]|nr:ABC transporter ATP-binding protein [Chloroflexota bacterium]